MMRRFDKLFTIVFISICSTIVAQIGGFNYVPLEFENAETEWVHVIYDSTIVNHKIEDNLAIEFDGYSHVSGLYPAPYAYHIIGEHLYSVQRVTYNNDLTGAIVEKIDLNSGTVLWRQTFDPREEGEFEYVYHSRIDKDRLVLYNLLIPELNPFAPAIFYGSAHGYLKIREYDLESGELLFVSLPDTLNESLLEISTERDGYGDITRLSEEEILVTQFNILRGDSIGFSIDTISFEGLKLNPSDTLYFSRSDQDKEIERRRHFLSRDDEGNHFLSKFLSHEVDGKRMVELELTKIDVNGNNDKVVISSEENDSLLLAKIFEVKEDLVFIEYFYENSTAISSFNKNSLELVEAQRFFPYPIRFYKSVDESGYFLDDNFDGDTALLNIFEVTEQGIDTISSIKMSTSNYKINIQNFQVLEGGDLLISLQYNGYKPNGIPLGLLTALVRIDPEQFGLISVDEAGEEGPVYKVYPNPTANYFNVEVPLEGSYSISLFDMQGKTIERKYYDIGGVKKVYVSDIVSGNYLIVISTGSQISAQIIKMMD